MNQEKVDFYLSHVSKAFNIPVIYVKNDESMSIHQPFSMRCKENNLSFITERISPKLVKGKESKIYYDINKNMVLIGIITKYRKGEREFILVGPISSNYATQKSVNEYLFEAGISDNAIKGIREYLTEYRRISFDQFLNILATINLVFNETIVGRESYVCINDFSKNVSNAEHREVKKIYDISDTKIENTESVNDFNKRLRYCMKNGLVELLPDLFNEMQSIEFADVNNGYIEDDFNNMKTTVIGAVFSSCDAAIESGVSGAVIEPLKYYYLNKIEISTRIEELNRISGEIIIDFTKTIRDNLVYVTKNPTINRVIKYIQSNLNTKLTAEKISSDTHIDVGYLFKNFKKETGKTLVDFINEEKVKKAEYYLLYTNESLINISDYLAFSSQSYFQTVFKKVKGMTPTEYRKQDIPKNI